MAISVANILFLMGLGFSLAAPIGPVNMEMFKKTISSRSGWILGLITGIGAMSADFIISMSVLFIGSEYIKNIIQQPTIYVILVTFNIAILGYIAYNAFKIDEASINLELSNSTDETNTEQNIDSKYIEHDEGSHLGIVNSSILKQYGLGFVIVSTSPWSYFWWVSFGSYIINSGIPLGSFGERLFVTLIFISGIFIWVVLLCSALSFSKKFASATTLKRITHFTALLIVGFAFKIAFDALVYFNII